MCDTTLASPLDRFAINPLYLFRWEATQQAHVLLYPEGIVKLNETAAQIIMRCDGQRTAAEVVGELQSVYPGDDERVASGVYRFLEVFRAKGWIRRQA
ncbi:pyrroloquinoline quinone biosynthesis peptide chaperone PqqD [Azohydromonas aeria]|uniref:pyrroloquinoline quinone biosynthesis peptide chaperone PqqD n=1 Tax=Azohydromonas aeria TaxID=2590212 RepID=UPI0012FAA0DB|nr:pyrroloquinoline quinone biosynthesis peptide chaperone PqqD [Azohydromonas aeria]